MEAPAKVPFAVMRSIVRHARDRAIANVCGQCSGLRQAMYQREPDMVSSTDDNGQTWRHKAYGQSPWRGVAWKQTDETARAVLEKLRWHGDHYAWTFNGMYIGIEPDGYMHT